MSRLLAFPLIAVILAVLACGSSATAFPEAASSANAPEQSSTASQSQAVADQTEYGTKVGQTLPQFEFTLSDGTVQSTASLSSQGRPVFLFFFTTW